MSMNWQKLRADCFQLEEFHLALLEQIDKENWWNIWVPKKFGGSELSFSEGLKLLKKLSETDGSLGWTVTLCSGANFFVGNLNDTAAGQIFRSDSRVCLGGSGSVTGTAEKLGDNYIISGKWKYATGSCYLSHFTLNAHLVKNGDFIYDENGEKQFRSFILPKDQVRIVHDWKTMGLKATVTNSFEVDAVKLHRNFSFKYDEVKQSGNLYQIPFSIFADLTLWVNYIGMACHFCEEAERFSENPGIQVLKVKSAEQFAQLLSIAEEVTAGLDSGKPLTAEISPIHETAASAVRELSGELIAIFPKLGIRAASYDQPINQIFRDYFTATQHHIFSKLNS
ncbi:MAG: acyl-CoA dehydrogenase [Bacteroidota bacterium]|nr:acyl-CoA dehydrogenase [Bacteroidota bacterium]